MNYHTFDPEFICIGGRNTSQAGESGLAAAVGLRRKDPRIMLWKKWLNIRADWRWPLRFYRHHWLRQWQPLSVDER